MIEQKLSAAAARLPEPRGQLPTAEPPVRRKFRPGLIAAVLAAVLLVGCVAGSVNPALWNGGGTESWDRVYWIAMDHNLQLPDTLLDTPFLDCSYLNLTEQRVHYLHGVFFPTYKYYKVCYGTELTLRDYHRNEDGGGGYSQWTEREEVVTVTFGSTASEYWRRQFGFDENDIWSSSSEHLISTETIERNGLTLYLATYDYGCTLSWYDYERGLVLRIRADSPEAVLTSAEEIFALNP